MSQLSIKLGFQALLLTTLAFASSEAVSAGKKKPQYLMGSMGDSITAGTLADTSTNPFEGWAYAIPAELHDLAKGQFNSLILVENKQTYSWASGSWIGSHFKKLEKRIKDSEGLGLERLNVAKPGAETDDLKRQAELLLAAMQTGRYQGLKYITLFMGNNNACNYTTVDGVPSQKMHDELIAAFDVLSKIQQEEPIRVLVVGLPRIPDLGKPEIKSHHTMAGLYSCEYFRSHVLKFCNNLTHWDGLGEYEQRHDVVRETNRVLAETVKDVNARYPGIQAHFSGALYEKEIPVKQLAADCFHPNKAGQQNISDTLWADQPWF